MLFGFFSKKSAPVVDAGSSTPALTDNAQLLPEQQYTPSSSIDSSSKEKDPSPAGSDLLPPSGPVDTPSPGLGPDDSAEVPPDPAALHALIASVPPQTLHAYTLAHISPLPPSPFPFANPAEGLILHQPPAPPSQLTLSVLTEFFSRLTPPPKLHCVRCHNGYFELENTDRSCLVPHDDDCAIVDRVRTGLGTEYETLWGCCGRTVDGDGDQGPPDGWCYEGRHTTDLKRARFRADATPNDDKLVSCARLRCGYPPLPRRASTRGSRKRARVDSNAEDALSIASTSHSKGASKGHRKTASASSSTKTAGEEANNTRPAKRPRSRKPSSVSIVALEDAGGDAMEVDADDSSSPLSSPPKSPQRPPESTTSNATKTKVTPKPRTKPRSKGSAPGTTVPLQRSPLSSSSFTAAATPSQDCSPSRPTTPNRKVTKVEVEILTKSPSMVSLSGHVAKKGSASSFKDSMVLRSSSPASTKKVSHRRGDLLKTKKMKMKPKTVGEIVETSIDGEIEWD